MADLLMRELKPSDVDVIVDIAVTAWTPIYAHFRQVLGDEIFEAAWPDALAEKARQVRSASNPGSRAKVLVAEREGRVAGFVTYRLNVKPAVGEIGNNAVHPDFQGRGIGSRLYGEVLRRMREAGMRFARVHTGADASHAGARRAYEKAGFNVQLPGVDYYRKL